MRQQTSAQYSAVEEARDKADMRSVLAPVPCPEPQVVLAVLRAKPGGPESVHVARVDRRRFKTNTPIDCFFYI